MPPKQKAKTKTKTKQKQKQKQKQSQNVTINIGKSKSTGGARRRAPSSQNNIQPIIMQGPPQQQTDYTPILAAMMQHQTRSLAQQPQTVNNISPLPIPEPLTQQPTPQPLAEERRELAAAAAERRSILTRATNFMTSLVEPEPDEPQVQRQQPPSQPPPQVQRQQPPSQPPPVDVNLANDFENFQQYRRLTEQIRRRDLAATAAERRAGRTAESFQQRPSVASMEAQTERLEAVSMETQTEPFEVASMETPQQETELMSKEDKKPQQEVSGRAEELFERGVAAGGGVSTGRELLTKDQKLQKKIKAQKQQQEKVKQLSDSISNKLETKEDLTFEEVSFIRNNPNLSDKMLLKIQQQYPKSFDDVPKRSVRNLMKAFKKKEGQAGDAFYTYSPT